MRLRSGEKFKGLVLILLMITSFIQVGILWSYNSHGFPTNFISAFLSFGENNTEDNVNQRYTELLKPYDIVVCGGFDGDEFIVNKSSKDFNNLWDDARLYLSSAMNSKPEVLDGDQWLNAISKQGFVFYFKTKIDARIFNKWVLKTSSSQASDYNSIYKIALIPKDGLDSINNNMALYVYDGTKIFKYILKTEKSHIDYIKSQNDYKTDIIKRYAENTDLTHYEFSYKYLKGRDDTRQDMLINVSSGQTIEIKKIISFLPEELMIQDVNNEDTQKHISDNLLGREKLKGYQSSPTKDKNAISIVNLNNIYTIYKNGFLDYTYKSAEQESGRGNIADAFENAVQFIYSNNRIKLLDGLSVYISNIQPEKDSYTFSFNYRMNTNGLPIVVNKDGKEIDAIVIKANGSKVLSSQWLFRGFSGSGESSKYKLSGYVEIADAIYADPIINEKIVNSNNGFVINELYPGYILDYSSGDYVNIEPEWIIKTSSEDSKYSMILKKLENSQE